MIKKRWVTILFLVQIIMSYAGNDDKSRALDVCKAGASFINAGSLGICTLSGISLIPQINPIVVGMRVAAGTYGIFNEIQHGNAYCKHVDKAVLADAKSTLGSVLQASACLMNASTFLRIGLGLSIVDVTKISSFNLTQQACYSVILPFLGIVSLFGAYNELSDVYRILKKH